MKKLLTILLLIPTILFSQSDDNSCEYISKFLKEKPLECIDKSKLKNEEEIYQFFKWSAFRQDYLITIERKGNIKTLVSKKIYKSSFNEETNEEIPPKFEILKQRKLTNAEFSQFKNLLDEHTFWEKDNYHVDPICNDGAGIIVYALRKDHFIKMGNGNCSPSNEYLNYTYRQLSDIFKLQELK